MRRDMIGAMIVGFLLALAGPAPAQLGPVAEPVCEVLGGCATCQADLGQCQSDRGSCDGDLAACQGDLGACQTERDLFEADLASCNDDLGDCEAGRASCESDLGSCNDDFGACDTERATCQADLGACEDNFAACSDALADVSLPATGQTTSRTADKNDGIAGPVAVPDDGAVQAGAPLAYVDNGDGTITDLNTGLMWEKKGDNGGLHDRNNFYSWSGDGTQETIWDWIEDVNAEGGTGFAGHSDWRIPNVKELHSVVDYGVFTPSVDPAFHNGCVAGCSNTACSCTVSSFYWSATTFENFPATAWGVSFNSGVVNFTSKTNDFFVRAVRSGS